MGFEDVGIQYILGKIFIPVSWVIGVSWEDCEAIGNVIGTKTIINEFVAYELLGKYKRAGEISVKLELLSNKTIFNCFLHSFARQLLQLMRFVDLPIPVRWA